MEELLKTVSINHLCHFMNYTFWEDLNVVSITIKYGSPYTHEPLSAVLQWQLYLILVYDMFVCSLPFFC